MKDFLIFTLAVALTLTLGFGVALAGNDAPAGPHYNLNIIGVEKGKKPTMTGTKGHTIFVGLNKDGSKVTSRIYLTEGEFEVCDRNGFDAAYSCELDDDGDPIMIGRQDGAVFQLPYNGCVSDDYARCDEEAARTYLVFVRALGTPGGSGTITTCVETYDEEGNEVDVCSTEYVTLSSSNRPAKFVDVTQELTTIVLEEDIYKNNGDLVGTKDIRYGLFEDEFGQYFWDYANEGLRMVQLRFYNLADIK